jgi:hypothetical protein
MTQAKKELLSTKKLSMDVISHIASFSTTLFSYESVSRKNRLLNRLKEYAAEGNVAKVVGLLNIRPDLRTQVLFTLAGLGAQDQMAPILKQRPEDLLVYRPLRDISGAQFERISLFQHALWTKDVRYMANMMLDCLPNKKQGETIRIEMVHQYEELMAKGVVYQLKGVIHEKERQFNLQPLIIALSTYVDNYDKRTETERKLYWCTVVGLAQTLLPAHIRHHYCDPEESFWDNPNFKKLKLKRSLEIYNWVLGKSQLWLEILGGLGQDFGVCSLGLPGRAASARGESRRATVDLLALKALDEVRTTIDVPSLIKRLYTPIQNLEENLNVQGMKL